LLLWAGRARDIDQLLHGWAHGSAFSVAAPPAWKTLPTRLKLLRSTTAFRRQLKTFPFQSAYGQFVCLQCFDAVGWVAGRAPGL